MIALVIAAKKRKDRKSKLYKSLQYWSSDVLIFDFLEKGLEIVYLQYFFVYDFSRKMYLMLYFINWPNFIVWLPFFLEILGKICNTNICFPNSDVINLKNWSYVSNQAAFLHDQKNKKKTLISCKSFSFTVLMSSRLLPYNFCRFSWFKSEYTKDLCELLDKTLASKSLNQRYFEPWLYNNIKVLILVWCHVLSLHLISLLAFKLIIALIFTIWNCKYIITCNI